MDSLTIRPTFDLGPAEIAAAVGSQIALDGTVTDPTTFQDAVDRLTAPSVTAKVRDAAVTGGWSTLADGSWSEELSMACGYTDDGDRLLDADTVEVVMMAKVASL